MKRTPYESAGFPALVCSCRPSYYFKTPKIKLMPAHIDARLDEDLRARRREIRGLTEQIRGKPHYAILLELAGLSYLWRSYRAAMRRAHRGE